MQTKFLQFALFRSSESRYFLTILKFAPNPTQSVRKTKETVSFGFKNHSQYCLPLSENRLDRICPVPPAHVLLTSAGPCAWRARSSWDPVLGSFLGVETRATISRRLLHIPPDRGQEAQSGPRPWQKPPDTASRPRTPHHHVSGAPREEPSPPEFANGKAGPQPTELRPGAGAGRGLGRDP